MTQCAGWKEKMKTQEKLRVFFNDSSEVLASLEDSVSVIEEIADHIQNASISGKKILVAGNGGSCSDAMHFVGELTCTYKSPDRKPFAALALNSNQSAITAWVNDFEFDTFYSRQVEALGVKGDVLFLFSTGGGDRVNGYSMNLVNAATKAKEMEIDVISLVGKSGGELAKISDKVVLVKSQQTALIQQAHITVVHAICELLE